MPSRLGDRLNAARQRQFVGRHDERAMFESALAARDPPFFVLYIFGPGGVGKTTLLREFVQVCQASRTTAVYVDGRNVEPSPDSFLEALGLAMGLPKPDSALQHLTSQSTRLVILLDTYETLSPLDDWLRQVFLPQLPEHVLVVLAGRDPPALAWRTDPGWQTLIRTLPLRNLSPDESQAYLNLRRIPPREHASILNFTRGHPLGLCLAADVFSQRGDVQFRPETAPDMIHTLLEQLVQKVPGPAHRTALEACAMVRVTTETLLAEMLGLPDQGADAKTSAYGLFDWLRGLSFIEARPGGLFPHDLVREAMAADVHWRNPDWYTELHRRARAYYTTRLQETAGQSQQRLLLDLVFLHRDNPVVRPFFEWQTGGGAIVDSMQEADVPALVAMVECHEGQDSAQLAAHWFSRQPEGVLVCRDGEGQPAGLLVMVALHRASPEDLATDPAAQLAWQALHSQAPLRPGEKATHFRFWMARESYQAVSALQSLIFVKAVQHYLTTPGLAFTFFPCAEPEFWAPVFGYADLTLMPQADFEVGGRRYGVYGHDWRARPPAAWLGLLAEREIMSDASAGPKVPPPPPSAPLIVLSQPDFGEAMRHALRHFGHPDELRNNPLLRSRLVIEAAGPDADMAKRGAVLKTLIKDAAESLGASPRQVKYLRALHHTYFQPTPTQEQAAELLDLPFSTYRRHLTTGMARVTEILWQQEIRGTEK